MKARYRGLSVIIVLLLISSFAMGGTEKAVSDKAKAKDGLYEQVELFADAISVLREDYVEDVDSKKLMYGAMRGMLSSLDDYSQFMEPDEYKEIQVETKGEFGGIGVEISLKEGMLTIITPIAGTPAEAAGLKPNDKIVKINGKITKDMTLDESVKIMRGKPGTNLTLTIWRDKNVFDVTIKRDIIKVHSIKKADLIEDKIGYIKLVEFQENTAKDFDEEMKTLESRGMDSLILDLRNNPGGLLEGAVEISERFLPKDKVIVSIKSKDPKKVEVFKSSGKFTRADIPLVVLVNDGSASASEIVAGAVKDNKRGIVIGTKTFGKASVQTVIPLRDGSALRLTTALYLMPSGKLIKDEGVAPDVIVERASVAKKKRPESEEIFEKVEDEAANKDSGQKPADASRPAANVTPEDKGKGVDKAAIEKDYQLESAINLMKAIRVYKAQGR